MRRRVTFSRNLTLSLTGDDPGHHPGMRERLARPGRPAAERYTLYGIRRRYDLSVAA